MSAIWRIESALVHKMKEPGGSAVLVKLQVLCRGGEEDVPCPRNVCASKTPNPGRMGLVVQCWDVLGGGGDV